MYHHRLHNEFTSFLDNGYENDKEKSIALELRIWKGEEKFPKEVALDAEIAVKNDTLALI